MPMQGAKNMQCYQTFNGLAKKKKRKGGTYEHKRKNAGRNAVKRKGRKP